MLVLVVRKEVAAVALVRVAVAVAVAAAVAIAVAVAVAAGAVAARPPHWYRYSPPACSCDPLNCADNYYNYFAAASR